MAIVLLGVLISAYQRLTGSKIISVQEIKRAIELLQAAEVALLAGLSQPEIALIELGRHSPTLDTVAKLSTALHTRFTVEPHGYVRQVPIGQDERVKDRRTRLKPTGEIAELVTRA